MPNRSRGNYMGKTTISQNPTKIKILVDADGHELDVSDTGINKDAIYNRLPNAPRRKSDNVDQR